MDNTLASLIVGACMGPPAQSILEHIWAQFPKVPPLVKSLAPTVLGLAGAYVAQRYGVDPTTAIASAAALVSSAHLVNASPLAVTLPDAPVAPVETVHYTDGSSATGAKPVPTVSPSGAPAITEVVP